MCCLLVKSASTRIPNDTFASGLPAYKFEDRAESSPSQLLSQVLDRLKFFTRFSVIFRAECAAIAAEKLKWLFTITLHNVKKVQEQEVMQ
jgi:hypothetical protein